MLTFFMPFSLYWKVSKQDEGCLVVFLLGFQLSLYTCSLDIQDSSSDPMGDGSTLPDLVNSTLGKNLERASK